MPRRSFARGQRLREVTPGLGLLLLGTATCPAAAQHLRVGAAMPVLGQAVALSIRPAADEPLPDGAAVQFRVAAEGAAAEWRADTTVREWSAATEWTPEAAGPYTVSAQLGGRALPPVNVLVVHRPLHFNYWGCAPTQRYVTSVMENSEDPAPAEAWLDRGVKPLGWQGGQCDRERFSKPEQWAEMWTATAPGRVGIMIDEFSGGDDVDQVMGDALLLARQRRPQLFLAPYCGVVSGERMIAGFRQSDLVLVETYRYDWRGYPAIAEQLGTAVQAGLADRAIAVLGLAEWATTERELRDQFAYVRTTLPGMPGVGFFPKCSPERAEEVDRAIYDYFLGPALLLKDGELRNIGQLPAKGVGIADAAGAETRIAELRADERRPAEPGTRVLPGKGYTVVDYVPPPERPAPTEAEAAAARTSEEAAMAGAISLPLAADRLALERAESENADVNGQVSAATVPLPAATGRAAALAFEVELTRGWFYGTVSVSLAGGKARLGVSFSHGDNDRDLDARCPRAAFLVQADDGTMVRSTCPPGLQPGTRYHVFVGWDGAQTARMSITDADGKMVWESGELPFTGPLTADRLRLEVTPFQGSDIAAQPDGSLLLRGVSGGPKPSPYVLEALVREVRAVARGRE